MSNYDIIEKPLHYNRGKVQCIDAIDAAVIDLKGADAIDTGNIIRYVYRWPNKNGLEDLKKARWYLNRLIERQENEHLQRKPQERFNSLRGD
ncbi:MAG: DUF3310 domain-containing protein [Christensenella sp.]|uniref:DUF3310 domain-containing protein n=1 Tax=Christensenella sp. TaxID=1935934 RepID=UPI002B203DAD|nr:DUF3310 domain-containing protein [Christensenella sp.]MEA5003844.1 DUF3310 domain-containing protein [Christensenella sp.]